MKKPLVRIYTAQDEYIDREMNDAEFAQWQIDQENIAARKAEEETKENAKAAAEAKLATLGLTTDDLRALGL